MRLSSVVCVSVALACGATPSPVDAGSAADASSDALVADVTGDVVAADTWTNWASPSFFQSYCVSCHTPGQAGDPSGANLDFTQYADVHTNANVIRCGVSVSQDSSWNCASSPIAEQFPIGGGPHPTPTERNRLVAWVTAGAPQ